MDDIRERFRAVRKALGLTMDAFGRSIGLSNSGISAIESGQRSVTDKHIKLICAAHPSVSEHWLRTGEGEMFSPSDSDIVAEVCKTYSLDSAGRLLLETVLDLPDGYAKVLLDVALKLAERSAAKAQDESSGASYSEIDIDAEVESYRQELLRQKKAVEGSSASSATAAREA